MAVFAFPKSTFLFLGIAFVSPHDDIYHAGD
jgi:hypothetical protein